MSETLHDALQRAQRHFRGAAREGLAAVEALFDAAILTGGLAGDTSKQLRGDLEEALAEWKRALESDANFRIPEAAAAPLRALLKGEIERWETRSETDASVRPVLRGLLALREVLWDFGLQGQDAAHPAPGAREPEAHAGLNGEPRPTHSSAARNSMAWASIEDDPGWDESDSGSRRGPWASRDQPRPAS